MWGNDGWIWKANRNLGVYENEGLNASGHVWRLKCCSECMEAYMLQGRNAGWVECKLYFSKCIFAKCIFVKFTPAKLCEFILSAAVGADRDATASKNRGDFPLASSNDYLNSSYLSSGIIWLTLRHLELCRTPWGSCQLAISQFPGHRRKNYGKILKIST